MTDSIRSARPLIRSMRSLISGVVVTGLGMAAVLDELTSLSFGQTGSLMALVGALVVLAAAVVGARNPGRSTGGTSDTPEWAADWSPDGGVDDAEVYDPTDVFDEHEDTPPGPG